MTLLPLVSLGLLGFTNPWLLRRIAPRGPAQWHVRKCADRRIELKSAAETDHQPICSLRGRATKHLPIAIFIVTYAQHRKSALHDLPRRNRDHVSGIGEWPLAWY